MPTRLNLHTKLQYREQIKTLFSLTHLCEALCCIIPGTITRHTLSGFCWTRDIFDLGFCRHEGLLLKAVNSANQSRPVLRFSIQVGGNTQELGNTDGHKSERTRIRYWLDIIMHLQPVVTNLQER